MGLIGRMLGAAGLGAALWSGGWVWGKSAIRSGLDEQIALMHEQGIAASYDAVEIGGFPFGYDGRIVEPRYAMDVLAESDAGTGVVTYSWAAPWMDMEARVSGLGDLEFRIADTQTLTIRPPGDAPPVTVKIDSDGLRGRLSQRDGRTLFSGTARSLVAAAGPLPGQADAGLRTAFTDLRLDAEGPQAPEAAEAGASLSLRATAQRGEAVLRPGDGGSYAVSGEGVQVAARLQGPRVEADIAAEKSGVAVTGGTPLDVTTGPVSGRASAPLVEGAGPQHLSLALDVREADPGAALWNMLDPAGAFPREIKRITLDAEASADLPGPLDDPATWLRATWKDATVKSLKLRGLGVEVDAEGQGSLIAGVPEGTAKLTLAGLDGFIGNAVKAGFLPQQQAVVYRLMLGSFGRAGDSPGQKVFDLALRDGLATVNGFPVGAAPR